MEQVENLAVEHVAGHVLPPHSPHTRKCGSVPGGDPVGHVAGHALPHLVGVRYHNCHKLPLLLLTLIESRKVGCYWIVYWPRRRVLLFSLCI